MNPHWENALRLLRLARTFNNQTVRDSRAMAKWHHEVDELSALFEGDDLSERYDELKRSSHREWMNDN